MKTITWIINLKKLKHIKSIQNIKSPKLMSKKRADYLKQ